MSFNKKFLSKSPLTSHGGPHNYQPDVTANTKAFSTPSDIMKKKVLEARQPEKSLTKTLLSTADNVAKSLTPVGVVKDLYNSAKDVYSDYQKGDYKSLGKKVTKEVGFAVLPYGAGKVIKKAKPIYKAVKKNIPTKAAMFEGIGPRALKNDGTLKRGVNKAGFEDFKKTGIVRGNPNKTVKMAGGFDIGTKPFIGKSGKSQAYFTPKLSYIGEKSKNYVGRYYKPGGAIYEMKNPNIKFENLKGKGGASKFSESNITSNDINVYKNYPIIGFRNF